MDNLDVFINQLIDEKGLTGLDEETRKTVVDELKSSLTEQVNRAVLMELPDEKLDELDNMMNEGPVDEATLQAFLVDSGLDVNKIATETMIAFKAFYLGHKGTDQA